jgi:hypothetical protein|tara:strand:+ start:8180 stop:8668 length:489 start_codon:yes stop_codon:yes gene_type:complete
MANLVSEQELFFKAFEPKMANRFIMYVDGLPTYVIKGVSRPTISQDSKVLNHINVQRYVKGRSVWGPVSMTLFDPIVPSAAQSVMEWVRLHHESVTGRDGYSDFYKKDLTINVLGPVGDKVEEWILKGAQITEANFGELNFDGDDPVNISLTVQPDYCILNY